MLGSLFNKGAGLQVFSSEVSEIFKNACCEEHLGTTAPDVFFLSNAFFNSSSVVLNF